MSEVIQTASERLLAPGGLGMRDLERTLNGVLGQGIDAGDVYFQLSRAQSWVLEDGIIREGSHSIEQGVGVRAIAGEKTGFAYSDEIVPDALMSAAKAARAIARAVSGGPKEVEEPISAQVAGLAWMRSAGITHPEKA